MPGSPYDEARAAGASPYDSSRDGAPPDDWDRPLLPSIAIVANVPTDADYLDPLAHHAPLILIAVAFHRMFESPGKLKKRILGIDGWERVKTKTVVNDVYVSFGQYSLLHYISREPGDDTFGKFNTKRFLQLILNRYNTYQEPRPFDFCVKDPDLTLSTKMINSLTGQDQFSVKKETGSGSETVSTLTEALSRQDSEDGAYFEAFLLRVKPIEMCYEFKKFEFSAEQLQPPEGTTRDAYFKSRQALLDGQLIRYNAVLNLLNNYGNSPTDAAGSNAALHEQYVDLLSRVKLEIGGHTDRMGEPDSPGGQAKFDNKKLSEDRAKGIVDHVSKSPAATLDCPPVGPLTNLLPGRLLAAGYGADECIAADPSKPPEKDRACRKVTVRLKRSG